jgi:hypothetical protein
MRYLPPLVYVATAACGAVLVGQKDWKLLSFGLAVLVPSMLAALLALALPMAVVAFIVKSLHAAGVRELGQRRVALLLGLALNGSTAAAYCVAIFALCFATQPVLVRDTDTYLIRLVWVALVACCPWARLTAAEQRTKSETPFEDLLLAALLIGCGTVVWTAVQEHSTLSWERLALLMAAPVVGVIVIVTAIAVHAFTQKEQGIAGPHASDCRVHMLGASSSVTTIETWKIGENISSESYEKFKDSKGDIYASQHREDGETRTHVLRKDRWEELRKRRETLG